MNKAFLLFYVLLFFGACSSDEEVNLSNKELLTNSQSSLSKTWYLYSQSPDDSDCPVTSDMFADNSYIFYADGTFEYDHGTITDSDNCGGDFVNFTGTWGLSNDDTHLKIVGKHEKGNPDNAFTLEMFDADIALLEEGRLQIKQTDPDTGTEYSFEFRVRQ